MEGLLSYFIKKGVPEIEGAEIAAAFKVKKIAKGEFFAEEGRTSKHLAFVTKGLFKYFCQKDGKEITTYVTGENTFPASVCSFYSQKPSNE